MSSRDDFADNRSQFDTKRRANADRNDQREHHNLLEHAIEQTKAERSNQDGREREQELGAHAAVAIELDFSCRNHRSDCQPSHSSDERTQSEGDVEEHDEVAENDGRNIGRAATLELILHRALRNRDRWESTRVDPAIQQRQTAARCAQGEDDSLRKSR